MCIEHAQNIEHWHGGIDDCMTCEVRHELECNWFSENGGVDHVLLRVSPMRKGLAWAAHTS